MLLDVKQWAESAKLDIIEKIGEKNSKHASNSKAQVRVQSGNASNGGQIKIAPV